MQLVHAGNVFPMQNCHSCNLFSFSFVYQSPWHRGFFHCNFFCLYTEMTSEKYFAYVCIVHHLMFEYKWNMYPILFCLWIRKAGCKLRRVYLLVLWMLGGRWVWKKLFLKCFFLTIQVYIEKQKGEILGVVIVESGWGSILPTVIIANMMHGGPAEKSGKLNIGDQIMSINGTSLVGLPLSTCQSIIKVRKIFLEATHFKTVT